MEQYRPSSHQFPPPVVLETGPFQIDQEMVDAVKGMDMDELISFTEAYKDPASDSDTEMLIFCHYALFKQTSLPSCLNVAGALAKRRMARTPPPDPRAAQHTLTFEFLVRSATSPTSERVLNLDQFKRIFELAYHLDLDWDPDRYKRAWYLGIAHDCIFRETSNIEHLDSAIIFYAEAVSSGTDGCDLADRFETLESCYRERYNLKQEPEDIDKALGAAEMADALTPSHMQAEKSRRLALMGSLLGVRALRSQDREDLDRAIEALEVAKTLDPNIASCHTNLSGGLVDLRSRIQVEDLDRLIQEDLADPANLNFEALTEHLDWIRVISRNIFNKNNSIQELTRPVEAVEFALATLSPTLEQEHKIILFLKLERLLSERYHAGHSVADMARAITVIDMVVDMSVVGPESEYPTHALWRANSWGMKADQLKLLDRTLSIVDKVIGANPTALELNESATCLRRKRWEITHSPEDIRLGLERAQIFLDGCPPGHPRRYLALLYLSQFTLNRSKETGRDEEVKLSRRLCQEAIDIVPAAGPERAMCLQVYAHLLLERYDSARALDDINHAAEAIRQVVELRESEEDQSDNKILLLMLTQSVKIDLAERSRLAVDMDAVVECSEKLVAAIEATGQRGFRNLGFMGCALISAHIIAPNKKNLLRAVNIFTEALNLTGDSVQHDYQRMSCSMLLSYAYWALFVCESGTGNNLSQSIHFIQMAVQNATSVDHSLSLICSRAGLSLLRRGETGDAEQALGYFLQGWHAVNSDMSERVYCAFHAANILTGQSRYGEASILLEQAIEFLPTISSNNPDDQESLLWRYTGIACEASAVTLESGGTAYKALRLLETGRGVISGLLLDMRTDISDLQESEANPSLVNEFLRLQKLLDSPGPSGLELSTMHLQGLPIPSMDRQDLREQFHQVVDQIRELPGFEGFLQPLTEKELLLTADRGPIVVINVHKLRCDALLIRSHEISALKLDRMHLEDVEEKARNLKAVGISLQTLEWLWDVAASPILDELGIYTPPAKNEDWLRVTWILTGALSHFPIHASGYYGGFATNETVMDRVMSSYSSSIKALIHCRRLNLRRKIEAELDTNATCVQGADPIDSRVVIVAMSETPGGISSLPYAATEVERVRDICSSMNLKVPKESPHQRRRVLEEMVDCKIFHFAGHGESNPIKPSSSRLLLDDWTTDPLTVADLRALKLQENPPFLGYLSACSTSANDAADLVDEGIHLVSAFHLAGFQNIIGTLWPVSDPHCVDVARILYSTIRDRGMTDEAVCLGLHLAVRAVRDRRANENDDPQPSSDDYTNPITTTKEPGLEGHENVAAHASGDQSPKATEPLTSNHGGKEEDKRGNWRPAELIESPTTDTKFVVPLQELPQFWAPYIHFGLTGRPRHKTVRDIDKTNTYSTPTRLK